MTDVPPFQLTIDLCYTITPNKFHISKNAHIPMADGPPFNATIDPCYTITPDKFHISEECDIYPRQMDPPSN